MKRDGFDPAYNAGPVVAQLDQQRPHAQPAPHERRLRALPRAEDFVSVERSLGYVPFLLDALNWQWIGSGAASATPSECCRVSTSGARYTPCSAFPREQSPAAAARTADNVNVSRPISRTRPACIQGWSTRRRRRTSSGVTSRICRRRRHAQGPVGDRLRVYHVGLTARRTSGAAGCWSQPTHHNRVSEPSRSAGSAEWSSSRS